MGRFTIGYQILLAALLGIFVGLFFGPLTAVLTPIGSAYTMLLQMAVLPYITFSLIHGLGSITPEVGKKIFRSGWIYLLILWVFILAYITLIGVLIPNGVTPIIHSDGTNQIASEFAKNFLSNLIPENPFYDVLNNIVPALATFGLIGGVALMHVQKKEPLIGTLERINQSLEKILKWLGILSPIGAFAYISVAFGTIHFEDLLKLEVYVVVFICSTLIVVFWLLPTLLATLSPLSYREALKAFRFVCLIPFVTGLSTAALPFLNIYLKRLSQKHETHEHFRETSQTILPIAYSFGQIGNAMILFFIFFISYYYHRPFNNTETSLLTLLTVPLSIGTSTGNVNSILFLIPQLGFPKGAAELFLELKSFTSNFQVLMSIASVLTLILLTIYGYYGLIKVQWNQLVRRLILPFAVFTALVFVFRSSIKPADKYENLYMSLTLPKEIETPQHIEILKSGQTGAKRSFSQNEIPEVFKQILTTGVLKVGFNANSIPYCYFNNQGELVGFDIAYAYALASDLGCDLELIPFLFNDLTKDLTDGTFDIGMSSIIMTEKRLLEMGFSFPYLEDNNVLIVPRSQKNPYLHLEKVKTTEGLVIGAEGAQAEIAKKTFPLAKITSINSPDLLLEHKLDALFWSETTAVIWCLSNPDFVTISYGNAITKSYFGYPVRRHATDFGFFLNNWMTLKEQSGFKTAMKDYWINGISPEKKAPRWSILRNILKWGG